MKKLNIALGLMLVLALGLLYWQQAQAQNTGGTQTAQQASHYDACTPINGTAASGSAATLTIPAPPSGQFIYIGELDIEVNTSAATAGEFTFTSTNVGATSIQWLLGVTATIGAAQAVVFNYGPGGLKSTTAATKATVVGPTGVAGLTQNMNACYWYSP